MNELLPDIEQLATSLLPQELPMTVWLRGDEPYCEEFCLDADAVMEQLSIRRSRLTQISGKELRVGRRRTGRNIRAFYRPEDVLGYKEWTRAPISQHKSSQLLNSATSKITEQVNHLAAEFSDLLDGQVASLLTALQDHLQQHLTQIHLLHEQLLSEMASITQQLHLDAAQRLSPVTQTLMTLVQESQAQGMKTASLNIGLEALNAELRESKITLQRQEETGRRTEENTGLMQEQLTTLQEDLSAQWTLPKPAKAPSQRYRHKAANISATSQRAAKPRSCKRAKRFFTASCSPI